MNKGKLKSFFSNLNFTKSEGRILLLIIGILTVGFSVKFYNEVLSIPEKSFDMETFESRFTSLAKSSPVVFDEEKFYNALSDDEKVLYDSLKKIEEQFYDAPEERKKKINIAENSIDLNSASMEELIALPGIGEVTAERIIQFRETKGRFRKIEDIMNVKGIGKKKFENIKPYIKVSN